MSEYHITPPITLPSLAAQEARAKRKAVLARAAATRRANYQRFIRRRASYYLDAANQEM